MSGRFDGKTAIVTGAASGIGAATARRFAAEGAAVVVADVDEGRGTSVADVIVADGGVAQFERCDVASLDQWSALAAAVKERFGRIDVVHNNAYSIVRGPAHELEEEAWDRTIDVCLKQVFLSVRACMSHLLETGGTMVNTSSIHAEIAFPGDSAYDAAKGGVSALTRTLAAEYGPDVRVNAVLPGAVDTPAWEGVSDEDRAAFAELVVAKRLGRADEVAAAVCFLASDDASYITGQNLVVDGGFGIVRG